MYQAVVQMGYITKNLNQSLDYWLNVIGAGPFFLAEFTPINQIYRGQPTEARFTVAFGYSGDMNIEIIEQSNDAPSAYGELFATGRSIPRGGLFHHVMIKHDDYDATYARLLEAGADRCYDAVVPGVGRYCYLDARVLMDCFVELLEVCPMYDAACAKMRAIHLDWDRHNPRRAYADILAEV